MNYSQNLHTMKPNNLFTTIFASLQWFVYIFVNTIVVPISVGSAFALDAQTISELVRNSLIITGIACVLQGLIGHRLPLMEGHSGLMWGLVLNLSYAAAAMGMSLPEVGGGIAAGMLISGAAVAILAAFNGLRFMQKIFTPMVMSVFLFLLTLQLILIFFKGMFKIAPDGTVVWPETLLALAAAVFVCLLKIMGGERLGNFSILIGIVVGWIVHTLLFPQEQLLSSGGSSFGLTLFPLGTPNLNISIIIVTCLASFINLSNTITAVMTGAQLLGEEASQRRLNRSYMLNGVFSMAGGALGLVSFAPFSSSIGFLQSTRIFERKPFIIGGILMIGTGVLPFMSRLFATIPVTIGNAVLLVAYFQLLGTSLNSIKGRVFDSITIHRIAIPVLVGLGILSLDAAYFEGIPVLIRPLVSNGFITGILLSILLELFIPWEKLEEKSRGQKDGQHGEQQREK